MQGNIEGGRTSLWIRAWLQEQLFILGCFLQGDAGKVLFVAILVLSTFCVGLKSAQIHSRVDQLWVQGTLLVTVRVLLPLSLVLSKKRKADHDKPLWHIVHIVEYQCSGTGSSVEPLPSRRGRASHACASTVEPRGAALCTRPYIDKLTF